MPNKKVVIIDYQLSNLYSVKHACDHLGIDADTSSAPGEVNKADALILPGVGAFQTGMTNLTRLGLVDPIINAIRDGKPFMGICLGLQLLFTESEEFGTQKGLGIIEGKIKRFPRTSEDGQTYKVPQIGWNKIRSAGSGFDYTPLTGIPEGAFMYFVHSYYAEPAKDEDNLTLTNYSRKDYCSGIHNNNIFAVQFHPEKSGELGLKIYKNWALYNGLI